MWLLKKIKDGTTKYLISEKKSYTVGRKSCDIILEEDASISRKHCTIFIDKKEKCPFSVSTVTGVWIVDEQSKYGTFLNNNSEWSKINSGANVKLTEGSIVKFGLMENVWSLEYMPIIACTSGVLAELKKEVENSLKLIDGELKNAWTKDCSLVIVNEITLTVKVVLALIHGVPIVTSQYVQNLVNSVKNQLPLPDYKNFKPDIKESILDASLISLDVKQNRKELFKGKKFVIPTKRQLETLREVIISAGGQTELFSSTKNWEDYEDKNVILIQTPVNSVLPESLSKSFKEVATFLSRKHGKRVIPESEIAQAVAYSSIEKYCNPESTCFSFKRTVSKPDPGVLIVEETPYTSEEIIPEPCVVPSSSTTETENESCFSKPECNKSISARKRNHSPEIEHESSKRKIKSKNYAAENKSKPGNNSDEKDDFIDSATKGKIKKSPPKNSFITNYFKKQAEASKNSSKTDKQTESVFWNQNVEPNVHKRKLLATVDSYEDYSKRKKVDQPNSFNEKSTVEVNEASFSEQESSNFINSSAAATSSSLVINNHVDSVNENDLSDFIEKENTRNFSKYGVDELNNTIFSLTLISSAYLNEDGSLIDPPSVPVNVKKFKKQTIRPVSDVLPLKQVEDELPDEKWIEPHPLRLAFH